jgi:nucleoside-diphosphate-sugar epimerase
MIYVDIPKTKQMLNYQPKVKMEGGIKRFAEWYKKGK